MAKHKIAVLIGSLRKGSYTRMVAKAMCMHNESLECEIVEIGHLPLYNQDLEDAGAPKEWLDFRKQIRAVDAVLFATPEYNRSIPGGLKNAIDVGSRPYGQSVWSKKPAAVVSVTPGALGAFGANHHLRQCFVFLDMPAMQQPEAYIANAAKLFDGDGNLAENGTREFLRKFMDAFARWIETTAPK
ncbi:MAG TPA: NADPH-dependent FMN reductase [Usitatibacter sp.]|nr:NADPH-dependent FMN reductase [Usitatibacter sp.]